MDNIHDFLNRFNPFFSKAICDFSEPNTLQEALIYATMNGGKRIRPVLCFIFAKMLGNPLTDNTLLSVASSLEAIHCYSLVHDDLPAMDNDDLRRGIPTTHKKYTEATAILVGDALQAMAFDILSSPLLECSSDIKLQLIHILSHASGAKGMVNGQFLDMNLDIRSDTVTLSHIQKMHQQKTGALIKAACVMGATLGDIHNKQMLRTAHIMGDLIGRIFQIQDDILDMTQSTQTLGKTAGKDLNMHKPTITALMGLENAQIYADNLITTLREEIQNIPVCTKNILNFLDILIKRRF